MKYALVTGAARGLGLELAKRLLIEGYYVFCMSTRNVTRELEALVEENSGTASIVYVDVGSTESVKASLEEISKKTDRLDIVVNNAAVLPTDSDLPIDKVNPDLFLNTININTIGALRVCMASIPLLKQGEDRLIINISSAGGSLKHIHELDPVTDDFPYGYCMSKSALNMGSAILQRQLKPVAIKVICVHPGVMSTRMNDDAIGEERLKLVDPRDSARSIIALAFARKHDLDGPFFFNYTGEPFPY